MVVVRTYPGLDDAVVRKDEPITWLHELGHTLGLEHNLDDASDVMASGVAPENKNIDPSECKVFSGASLMADSSTPAGAAVPNTPKILEAEATSQRDAEDVEAFVKQSLQEIFQLKRPKKV